jgi:hypothetical protein
MPFLEHNVFEVLNVASPRASKEPKVAQFVLETLDRVFNLSVSKWLRSG